MAGVKIKVEPDLFEKKGDMDAHENLPKMTMSEGWNRECTQLLCNIMFELRNETTGTTPDLLYWVKVSLRMANHGCPFSSTFLKEKWKDLINNYNAVKSGQSQNGNNGDTSSWEFYHILDAFYSNRSFEEAISSPQHMLPFVTCSLDDSNAVAYESPSTNCHDSSNESITISYEPSATYEPQPAYEPQSAYKSQSAYNPQLAYNAQSAYETQTTYEGPSTDGYKWSPDSPVNNSVDSLHNSPSAICQVSLGESRQLKKRNQKRKRHLVEEEEIPVWFKKCIEEIGDRIEQKITKALDQHTHAMEDLNKTLKDLIMCMKNNKKS